jgi:hypothetical protein
MSIAPPVLAGPAPAPIAVPATPTPARPTPVTQVPVTQPPSQQYPGHPSRRPGQQQRPLGVGVVVGGAVIALMALTGMAFTRGSSQAAYSTPTVVSAKFDGCRFDPDHVVWTDTVVVRGGFGYTPVNGVRHGNTITESHDVPTASMWATEAALVIVPAGDTIQEDVALTPAIQQNLGGICS